MNHVLHTHFIYLGTSSTGSPIDDEEAGLGWLHFPSSFREQIDWGCYQMQSAVSRPLIGSSFCSSCLGADLEHYPISNFSLLRKNTSSSTYEVVCISNRGCSVKRTLRNSLPSPTPDYWRGKVHLSRVASLPQPA